MSYVHPAWLEHQRKRFTRADAYRLAPSGSPEAKPPGWLDPSATRVRLKEAQEEEARARAAAEQEALERELLQLRWEVKKLKLDHELWCLKGKYSSSQPRDDRGRWTDGGGATELSAARKIPAIVKEFGKWTARQYVSRYCEAKVNRELPGQFENMTIADIWNIAKGGDARARTCMKLMQPRFKK